MGAESGLPLGHLHRDALPSLSGGQWRSVGVWVRVRVRRHPCVHRFDRACFRASACVSVCVCVCIDN